MPPETYKPIVTLATSTVINDKPESVLIPKVLCSQEGLKPLPECTGCEHHGGLPNQYVVACRKKEGGDADRKG